MGLNTIVLIHNDALADIESNPMEFIKNLIDSIKDGSTGTDVRAGSFRNAAMVAGTVHSHDEMLFLARGNGLIPFRR